ncbi:hypothetical protein DW66_3571 [Pseudomonas putida]|nr:hypothetical protein DW66_3571 [Pseudomonas putida]
MVASGIQTVFEVAELHLDLEAVLSGVGSVDVLAAPEGLAGADEELLAPSSTKSA